MQGGNLPEGVLIPAKKRSKNKFKLEGGPPKRREKLVPAGQAPPPSKKQRSAMPQPLDAAVPPQAQPPMQQPARAAGDGESKRKKKKRRQQQLEQGQGAAAAAGSLPASDPQPEAAAASRRTEPQGNSAPLFAAKGRGKASGVSLLDRMRQRLQGGRFRWLNEMLYTTGGEEALSLMTREPDLYEQYHEGFREQTTGWPVQPVDAAISWLRGRPAGWAVADLGCGDARIAAVLGGSRTVHSFDLVATVPGVVACNMAHLPLGDASVDVAVFCLSLMGTDYGRFMEEAVRIVRPGGWVWVAEVQSRFVDASGASVLAPFLAAAEARGLSLRRKNTSNSFFLTLELQKEKEEEVEARGRGKVKGGGRGGGKGGGDGGAAAWPELRACQYKKR